MLMAKLLWKAFFLSFYCICYPLHNVGCELNRGDQFSISTSQNHELPQENESGAPHGSSVDFRNYLVVSTLDGRVTALDPRNGGQTVWSLDTGPGELLSSSLGNIKIPIHGQWATLVPSLDGYLYKFDGRSVEPLPVSADTLLKSSYKISDNLVIIGGKETKSYGVNLQTGELKYACSMDGCDRFGEVSNSEDILVIERQTQTIRAVHSRTGIDQWNFSVGEHRLTMSKGMEHGFSSGDGSSSSYIANSGDSLLFCDDDCGNVENSESLKVVIPEGLIAVTDGVSNHFTWSQQFPSPIVNVWKLKKEAVWTLDLFSQDTLIDPGEGIDISLPPPLLVLGVHDKQLYIKQSIRMKDQVVAAAVKNLNAKLALPQIKWMPYISTAPSRTPYLNSDQDHPDQDPTAMTVKEDFDYPYDNGFYLYDSRIANMIENTSRCAANSSQEEEIEESFEQIIIVSLWHWWKEVVAISLVTSVLVNVIVYRFWNKIHSPSSAEQSGSEIHIINPTLITRSFEDLGEKGNTDADLTNSPDFVSRYLADFEPVECLGKGGFGVVFEAKNKMDDCSYAVKRIGLNNKEEAFEKVMREVKALAKLEHPGIVRYFNSWVECPPPGWQENKDKEWDDCSKASSSIAPSSPSSTEPQRMISPKLRNPFKPFDSFDADMSLGFSVPILSSDNASRDLGKLPYFKKALDAASSDSFEVVFAKNTNSSNNSASIKDVYELEDETETFGNSHSERDFSLINSVGPRYADTSESTEEDEYEDNSPVQKPFTEGKAERPSVLGISKNAPGQTSAPKIYLFIQMQLCRKENLKDWLNSSEDRDHYQVLDIFDQIVCAVDYVHECGLMHRDLKPSNIFFTMDWTIKIGDFGLVTAVSDPLTPADCVTENSYKSLVRHTDQVGTQLYMSPEQISRLSYNSKVDIFSLGLMFFELLVPFATQSERVKVLLDVRKRKFPPDFKKQNSVECELASRLLSHNPNERPSTKEIKGHHLFKAFHQSQPIISRVERRRTLSQRMSSGSGSDCDISPPAGHENQLNIPS